MRAALSLEGRTDLVLEEISLREPADGEVVVRLDATAVCSTDAVGAVDGFTLTPRPFVTGHAATGVIEAVGPNLQRLRRGDRVIVAASFQCGRCYYCARGDQAQCDDMWAGIKSARPVGTRSDGSTVFAEGGVGAYAQSMVYRESHLVPTRSDLPAEQLALVSCGILSGLGAVLELAKVRPGDSVAVVGCGHLGLWMIQAARLAGARQIIAIEPLRHRRELAGRLGATDLVDPGEDPVAQVRDLTDGRGADVALEAAGTTLAMEQSFAMARPAGTVIPTSMESPLAVVTLPNYEYAVGSKRIIGCQSGGGNIHRDIPRFIQMIEDGRLDTEPFISRVFPLDDINQAFGAMRDRTVITGIVRNNV